jgi:hypothetical protein
MNEASIVIEEGDLPAPEAKSTVDKITVEEADLVPEEITVDEADLTPPSIFEQIRRKLEGLGARLTVTEESEEGDLDELITIIKYLPSGGQAADTEDETVGDEVEEITIELGMEPAVELGVSAQRNQASAQKFFRNLRRDTAQILAEEQWESLSTLNRASYEGTRWYQLVDLVALANRWLLPVVIFRKQESHYLLVLKPPELIEDSYQVLVYDPIQGGERYMQLPNFSGQITPDDLRSQNFFFSRSARNLLEEGRYNLSLYSDTHIASNPELHQAKTTEVQFDGWNCGPACLFMAAIRAGAQADWSEFKFAGRDKLHEDTDLYVYTREEILSGFGVESE